jgi:aromatic ring-cleaving dioxygenase
MTPEQLQNYQIRTGELRAEYAENYVNSQEFQDASIEDRILNLTSMYSKARRITDSEMFRWSQYETEEPENWKKILDADAVPVPSATKKIKFGNHEYKLEPDDVRLLNVTALETYAERIVPWLEKNKDNLESLKKVDDKTKTSKFLEKTNKYWTDALDDAKRKRGVIIRQRESEKK